MATHTFSTMIQFMLIAAILLNLYTVLVRSKQKKFAQADKYLYLIGLGALLLALLCKWVGFGPAFLFGTIGVLSSLLVLIRNSQKIEEVRNSLPPKERAQLLRLYLGAICIAGILGGLFGYNTFGA
ncbi:hypothetical protein CIG75_20130 [Tumebacillus algifaecis]|uniref:Uncharacterized protein n=1 Tax=Tumebacillus algifaecis TaxID=1214604 RepID=A0A223D5V8_9BACL|nr:hypothetical protein [Tumebacillus algifaecis]ASS76979.1 hypothetical protein CIG75_20130 [Tumebacillus algifaecis]